MPGPAVDIIRHFASVEHDQRYTALVDLFAADATYYDPFAGPQVGRDAIARFMAKMEKVVPASGVRFEEWQIEGDAVCGWGRWTMTAPSADGQRISIPGQSVYRLTPHGEVSFVADYVNAKAYRRLRPDGPTPDHFGASGLSKDAAPVGSFPALDLVREFWRIQDSGDYAALAPLFADDAVFEDLIYGRFVGGAAIAGYLQQMKQEMPAQGIRFELVDAAGDTTVAWSQWLARFPDRTVPGWTLHTVRDGRFTLDADYF